MTFQSVAAGLAVALVFGATTGDGAAKAATPADLCPNGVVAKIRLSKLTPTGSIAGIEKAVADHAKWYRDHGFTEDRIIAAPILVYDAANKTMRVATDEVMTLHTGSREVPRDKRDAAWDAFVAEYKANSEVASETVTCLPR